MSVKKYMYLSMHDYFEREGFILKYSEIEVPKKIDDINHRIIRQVFSDLDIKGVDFNSSADVPAGTGMGSSSAFTVGLLNLCHAYKGLYASRTSLAEMACAVEIDKLGEPIGKQDQYGCALGGVNLIEFHPDETVTYEPVPLTLDQRNALESRLMMFYLGGTRSASALLEGQSKNSGTNLEVINNLKAMVAQAKSLRVDLCKDVDCLGHYLHEGWERKRSLASGITNPLIEEAYKTALSAGATGGKLLGAGGSGFLLLYVPDGVREKVLREMSAFQHHQIQIDHSGTTIIYSDC